MRVRLMLTTMALVVAAVVIVACGGDHGEGTPQPSTPTLSEDEAWAIVVDKVMSACPKHGPRIAQEPHRAYYTDGRWRVLISTGATYQMPFTVYEETRTVTGDDSTALSLLAGSMRGCR